MQKIVFSAFMLLFLITPCVPETMPEEETLPAQIQETIHPLLQRIDFLGASFLGNQLWQYIIFFAIIIISVGAAKILERNLGKKIRWFSEKTRNKLITAVTDNMRGPFELILIIIGARIGASFFYMTDEMRGALARIFELLIGITVTYVILKSVDVAAGHFDEKAGAGGSALNRQLLPVIRKAIKIFIVAIAFLVIIQNLGYNVVSLLTGLGIGGLAVALAAQQTLSNLFGSITIFADKPFAIGDWVEVDKFVGTVETIGLRSTRIRTFGGSLVTMPNSRMADSYIENVASRPFIRKVYTLGVTYETGHDRMRKTIETVREIYRDHPSTERSWVYFGDFGSHSLNILVFHWCKFTAYEEWLKATEEINLRIMKSLDEIGVEIAFPTQTLHIKPEARGRTDIEDEKEAGRNS